jgi:hypothetical protein
MTLGEMAEGSAPGRAAVSRRGTVNRARWWASWAAVGPRALGSPGDGRDRSVREHEEVLDDVLPYLACAHCGAALTRDGVRCLRGRALVLSVFAPRNGAELRRILSPAGRLLVVTPQRDHLGEIVRPLGLLPVDKRKEERLADTLGPYFEPVA